MIHRILLSFELITDSSETREPFEKKIKKKLYQNFFTMNGPNEWMSNRISWGSTQKSRVDGSMPKAGLMTVHYHLSCDFDISMTKNRNFELPSLSLFLTSRGLCVHIIMNYEWYLSEK